MPFAWQDGSWCTYLTIQSSHFVVRTTWPRHKQSPAQYIPSWRVQGTSKPDWRLTVAQHWVKGVSWRFTRELSHHRCFVLSGWEWIISKRPRQSTHKTNRTHTGIYTQQRHKIFYMFRPSMGAFIRESLKCLKWCFRIGPLYAPQSHTCTRVKVSIKTKTKPPMKC